MSHHVSPDSGGGVEWLSHQALPLVRAKGRAPYPVPAVLSPLRKNTVTVTLQSRLDSPIPN